MKKTISSKISTYIVLSLFSILTCYPLIWMLFGSLKGESEFYTNLWFLPKKWEWLNYVEAWNTAQLGTTFKNSIFVTGFSIIIVVAISYLASFAIARIPFKGSRIVLLLLLSTLMIPSQVTFIPLYQVELFLGIYNTYWGLILPYVSGGMPLAIFLLTIFITAIPKELDEAAEIDGCSQWGILWRIILPLTKPVLSTVIILTFINVWNEFFLALVMIQDPAIRTIPVAMTYFNQMFTSTNFTQIFAAMAITIIPVITIYVIFQRYFISGIARGAIKM